MQMEDTLSSVGVGVGAGVGAGVGQREPAAHV